MPFDRKTFITNLALGSGGLLFGRLNSESENAPDFNIPGDFSITYLATRWGYPGTLEEFCKSAGQAGYDGIEIWLPAGDREQKQLFKIARKHDLEIALLVGSESSEFEEHFKQFKRDINRAAELEPLFINCHAGRDFFSFEQNCQIINYTVKKSESTGIGIYHETHRSRILFAAHITRRFIDRIPELRLTLDISHWCNVHESLLDNQPEAVQLALDRTDHVHSRVGHPEGPQVTDPRAPEWDRALKAHVSWWDEVVKRKIDDGGRLTMTPEFGPPTYMPAVPYTGQPLGNQWEINVHMMDFWKKRYS